MMPASTKALIPALLAAAMASFSIGPVFADASIPDADIPGAADNPGLKRYEGSYIISHERFEYTDFTIPLSPLVRSVPDQRDARNNVIHRPERKVEAEGALTRLVYLLPEARSPLEVLRNYQDVIEEGGGIVEFECRREDCGGHPTRSSAGGGNAMSLTQFFFHESELKDPPFSTGRCALNSQIDDQRFLAARIEREGAHDWVAVQTYQIASAHASCRAIVGRTVAIVHILEARQRERRMVTVDAAQMASAIDETGSISLYGIYFDTDRTDLKPESEPTLREIAALLDAQPRLAVLVVGHTDSQGSHEYNLDLSARRAAAVKAALVAGFGIDAGRLATAGAGMMAPVATNDTQEGRALNRRVVLVKAN